MADAFYPGRPSVSHDMMPCEHAGTCSELLAAKQRAEDAVDRAVIAEPKCHAAREFLAFPGRDGGSVPPQLEACRRFATEAARIVDSARRAGK